MLLIMRRLSLLLVICFSVGLIAAQEAGQDIIHLQSGLQVRGTIVEYEPDDYVKLRKMGTTEVVTYPIEAVKRIEQVPDEANAEGEFVVPERIFSRVELKNGTWMEGVIVSYERGETLVLQLEDGREVTLQEENIVSISNTTKQAQKDPAARRRARRLRVEQWRAQQGTEKVQLPYAFRETGWFSTSSFAFSFGKRERLRRPDPIFSPNPDEDTRNSIGFNLQHIVGYHYSRMVGVGAGLSYDAYDLEDGESVLTVFGHYRGFFSQKHVTPFVAGSLGYGFALQRKEQGVIESDGGIMIHPELGLRLGGTDKANFMLSLGMRFQKAYYVTEEPFSGNIIYRDLWYRRLICSLAVTF